jgi:hypothetical protein
MVEEPQKQVLTTLEERDIDLPEDSLTREKIRERAFAFRFEPEESLSFHIERHPTMYLSDMGVPGLDTSPARFHVLTEYQLDLANDTWHIHELSSTFEYEPWMVVEAELGAGGPQEMIQKGIEDVRTADDPEETFEDVFGSWIDHWEEKFDESISQSILFPSETGESEYEYLFTRGTSTML